MDFEKALGAAAKFKTWAYLLMAGPYSKYLLEDRFHPEVQQVMCGQYDELWERYMQVELSGSVTEQRLPELLGKWYEWGQQQPDLC